MIRTCLSAAAGLTLLAGAARAAAPSSIEVSAAWSRPATPGLPTGVAYATLVNHGSAPDRLTGASSAAVGRISLHRSIMTAGVMRMEPVPDGLELPPGRAVALKPGGYHLMLSGLKGGLKLGQSYAMTFRFAHARPVSVQVQVRQGPAMTAMPGMR